jgi:hypothetical protein
LTEEVRAIGFPLGEKVEEGKANPSVSMSLGHVSALRCDADGRLCWIDVALAVASGNSGSAVVDKQGRLVGIISHGYAGFGRAIPVEFVKELLGEAALDVAFDPAVAPEAGGHVRVVVKPRGPAEKLVTCHVELPTVEAKGLTLTRRQDGSFTGTLRVPKHDDREPRLPVLVRAKANGGSEFERIVGLHRVAAPKIPVRVTLHSLTLKLVKANGWWWDATDPDPFANIYVNDTLVKRTASVTDQLRFLEATSIDCKAGDKVKMVVYDQDVAYDDLAGEIRFTAEPNLTVSKPSEGQIECCDVTVRAIPLRLPVKK